MSKGKQKDKNKYFTDKMFYRLFVPSVIAAAGIALGDIADALFVGIKLGNLGLATMSIVLPIYMIFNVLDVGIGVSASVEYSRCLGNGKAKEGLSVFSQMGTLALAVSVILGACGIIFMPYVISALGVHPEEAELYAYVEDYLRLMFIGAPLTFMYFYLYFCIRCDDGEKTASLGYTVGYLTDVAASAVFVLVFNLDVKGAILATLLGKLVGIVIFSTHLFRKWTILRFRFAKIDFKHVFKTLKIGFSSSVGYLFQFVVFLVINNILIQKYDSSAIAVFNVVQNVSYFALAIYSALGETIQPLCSTFFAEHNHTAIKSISAKARRIGIIVGGVTMVVFTALAPFICRFFGLSESLVSGGAHAVGLFCLSIIPAGISIITVYCFQSIKREAEVLLINALRTFAFSLIFAVVLSLFTSERYFWLYYVLTELFSLAIWVPVTEARHRKRAEDSTVKIFSYFLDNSNRDIALLLSKIEEFGENCDIGPKQMYYISICVEEMCQAIIDNAFHGDGDEYIQITIGVSGEGQVDIHIRDNAVSFDPFSMKTGSDYFESDEDVASLGIQVVKKKAKNFFYRRYNGFNTLTVEL